MNMGQKPRDWPTEPEMFTIWSFKKLPANFWSGGPQVARGIAWKATGGVWGHRLKGVSRKHSKKSACT